MKKFLSLMLTLALIITTLALPITASAADISLQGVGTNSINLTYEPTYPAAAASVRPGDSFSVNVVANVTGEIASFYTASFRLQYDAQLFKYNDGTATNGATVTKVSDGIIQYDYFNQNLAVENGRVVLATLNFEVNDTAFAALSKVISDKDGSNATSFTVETADSVDYYDFAERNLTETELTVAVTDNTAKALINSEEIVEGRTYYSTTGVTVTYEATNLNSATIVKDNGDPVTIPAVGYEIAESGSYKVKIDVKGGLIKTYNFNVSTADVQALLDLTGTIAAEGYAYDSIIELPVQISGLDGATADIISFNVNYDKTKFDLAVEGAGTVLKAGTEGNLDSVVYGEADGNDITVSGSEKATVATLKFTVKSAIAYGDYTLAISNPQMALVKSGIDPTADKINIQDGSKVVTVVPTADYVTVGEGKKTDWDANCSGAGYTQKINAPEGVEVKYIAVNDITAPDTTTQTGIASIFNSASALENGYMRIDKQSNYYIVTKVGSVYKVTNTLMNGTDIFYDGTAPTLDVSNVVMTGWAKEKTIALSDITASDDLSAVGKYEIALDGTTYTEITENSSYTFNETFDGNVTIKVTDKAGNSKTANAAIKVDKTVPTANITAGNQADGKKELTITAEDAHSGVASTVVSYSVTENGDYTEIQAVEGKYYADVDGWYKVVVTDNVGNTSEAKIEVSIDKISGTSDINVTVVKGGTSVKNGFLTKEAMTAKGITNRNNEVLDTNGTFTYVNITVDAPKDSAKYANKLALKKSTDADFTEVSAVELGQDKIGDYELKVTTYNKSVDDDYAESVYAFSIVAPKDMLSVNADKRYNIIDYAYIMKVMGNTDTGVLPTAKNGFWGGLFSGDVTGDLTLKTDDLTAIINSLRTGQTPGNYDFAIMNPTTSAE